MTDGRAHVLYFPCCITSSVYTMSVVLCLSTTSENIQMPPCMYSINENLTQQVVVVLSSDSEHDCWLKQLKEPYEIVAIWLRRSLISYRLTSRRRHIVKLMANESWHLLPRDTYFRWVGNCHNSEMGLVPKVRKYLYSKSMRSAEFKWHFWMSRQRAGQCNWFFPVRTY
jgi:hypothetical protein